MFEWYYASDESNPHFKSVEGFADIPRISGKMFGEIKMNHLDDMLAGISSAPLPTRLMTIDDAVLAQLSERQANAAPLSGSMMGLVLVTALGMGIAGAVFPSAPAQASRHILPFGSAAALAPSTLLDSSK